MALAVVATGTDSGLALVVGSLAFGLGVGTLITAPPLWVRTVLDRVPFELAYYRVNVALMAGAALGPILTAVLHDHLGGYGWTLAVLAGLDAVALGLLVLTPRLGPRATPATPAAAASDETTAAMLSPG